MTEENQAVDSEALAWKCVKICEDRKAENVILFDMREHSILADFFIICTGTSLPHIRAISNRLNEELSKDKISPGHVEGKPANCWMVLDYGTVLVHVMDPERRQYYNIEELWQEGTLIYRSSNED